MGGTRGSSIVSSAAHVRRLREVGGMCLVWGGVGGGW